MKLQRVKHVVIYEDFHKNQSNQRSFHNLQPSSFDILTYKNEFINQTNNLRMFGEDTILQTRVFVNYVEK